VPKIGPELTYFGAMSRVIGKPYFAYVLWSASGQRFYMGISEDPTHRLEQHNGGKSTWTARYRPWKLVHLEQFADYRRARMRELEWKRQKGGKGFYKMIGCSFEDLTRAAEQLGT
jgi:putative endonuclease